MGIASPLALVDGTTHAAETAGAFANRRDATQGCFRK
jgi:hypothetical protein